MFDENLIKLEQSLRETRKSQKKLINKREALKANTNKLLPEVERITEEIEALEQTAKQEEAAIYSILTTLRTNKS